MNASTTRQREEVMGAIARLVGTDQEDLAQRLLEHVATEDLAERPAEVMAGLVTTMRELAEHRDPEQTLIRVFNPDTGEHGWTTPHTIVQVCTDDMPFLVDSVTAALSGTDHLVDLVIHPQLAVRRDEVGTLEQVRPERPPTAAGAVESWMTFAVDRMSERSRAQLTERLQKVLADVRSAVGDWIPMRQRCEEIARELDAGAPATVDRGEVEPTVGFLSWLAQDNFTFLGYREYLLDTVDGDEVLRPVPGTGLGILRHAPEGQDVFARLRPEARRSAREPHLLTITKANSRATVHRPVYLDYIGVRTFDADGQVTGERRFLGMFTTAAYAESVMRLPIVSDKVRAVLDRSGFSIRSHSGKDLLGILEGYPRDELFQADVDTLVAVTADVLHLAERRRSKLFLRRDEFGRFVSCLVYLPRDRYNTTVRLRVEAMLRETFGAEQVDHTTRVSESPLAQLHFVLRMPRDTSIPDVDTSALQTQLAAATRTWEENLLDELHDRPGEDAGMRFARGFPEAYKEDFGAAAAVNDLAQLDGLTGAQTRVHLYTPAAGDTAQRRVKIYRAAPLILTDVLPMFTDLGVDVLDERPYTISDEVDGQRHVYDFGLRLRSGRDWPADQAVSAAFEEALLAVRDGRAESDPLGELVLTAGLVWREVVVLRTIARYLRQIGSTFSVEYLESALVANPDTARRIVALFEARFDPDHPAGQDAAARERAQAEIRSAIHADLEQVASLDQDRIVRSFMGVIDATLRTNYFQTDDDGAPHQHVSLKLACAQVPGIPAPVPMAEIWVYSPRVEGVHLRFGAVARGGLRWSDRREDFRTEVLGLVKAQMVKNAVIVPTGSKGGFVAKQLPDP
ncbi:MAG TPA: NAD-glutamate dehydrogenase domain-containing protein, partial [Ruania sp.]|nr:NAD-glutamate dehydrogenase domain-containing protein [Ruania sp.]